MIVKHSGYNCKVIFGKYGNGNNGIQLVDQEDDELVAVASVNGETILPDDLVGIKTWSENVGIAESLVDANIIKPELLGLEPSGFVAIEYYRLTDEALSQIAKEKPTDGNQ